MQRQIAVAFQGGGARLISLIAAADALSELERTQGIKIRAVSGSSAGSIAAFLLAADADFDRVKDVFRRLDPTIRKKFPRISTSKLYLNVLRFLLSGKPIYDPRDLETLVAQVLTGLGVNPHGKIQDIKRSKKMFLMYSDIYSALSEYAGEGELIRTAIARSCALPIVFSSYKDFGGGQRVDGGMFDNLPTDVLMRDQTELGPVFAIGFKADSKGIPNTASGYLYSLATSGVQNRISSSKKAVGEDMVLELKTNLGTLDFDKIVSIGIEEEYNQTKEQARQFFRAYLSGQGTYLDPMSESRGVAPLVKLKTIERSIHDYVYDSLKKANCNNRFVKMRVNAYSLANPSNHDEIFVEQLINFSEGDYIKGAILPMTNGAGYTANVECQAWVGGSNGEEINCEKFIINDYDSQFSHTGAHTNMVVLLFKGDLKKLIGQSVYLLKKERRYGFMFDLMNRRPDFLATRSFYWPADEITIALNVPRDFPSLRCEWLREEGPPGPPPESIPINQNLVPAGFTSYTKAIRNVRLGTRLKGNFYCEMPGTATDDPSHSPASPLRAIS
jgi:predicted acylesterase/phospholipase RssA